VARIHDEVRQKLSSVTPATWVRKVSFSRRWGASNFLVAAAFSARSALS